MLRYSLFFFLLLNSFVYAQPTIELSDYLHKRDSLLRVDSLSYAGYQMPFSPEETLLAKKMRIAQREMLEAYKAGHFFPPARNFYASKQHIEQNPFFHLLRTMPKGGALHLHDLAIADARWIVQKAIETPEMYIYWGEDNGQYIQGQMHAYKKGKAPQGFVQVEVLARKLPSFEEHLLALISFDGSLDADSMDIWKEFEYIFQRIYGFASYAPIYPEHLYNGLRHLIEDKVQHVELRGRYGNHLYDLDHKPGELSHEALMKSIREVYNRAKTLDPAFTLKLICANLRFMSQEHIWQDMQMAIDLHKQDPDLIKGYDLVAEEDNGNPTLFHVEQFLKLDSIIKTENLDFALYLHDGESSWMHVSNLYDAVLLGSRRIGHGFNLFRFPNLMNLVKERNICIEVNPLSNQILGYIRDLRLHPANTYMRMGVDCVISSDDPQLFDYQGLSYDFWSAYMAWELDLSGLKELSKNSLKHAALSEEEKKEALQIWEKRWNTFVQDALVNWDKKAIDSFSRKINSPKKED